MNLLNRYALPLGLILIVSLFIGAYFIIQKTTPENTSALNNQITIDIAGAVYHPGVYNFNQGDILEDAINKAGGITNEANIELIAKTINRAALLQNHGKVYIPFQQTNNQNESNPEPVTSNLININTASAQILDILPGIGPITASRIIEYRETNGNFKRKDDLMKVEGISTSKYSKLKDLITI